MGMYDTINGEQVKCFPWISFYKEAIGYHGGDLRYYNTGCEVPYKRPHYNYGKNFIILDLNRYQKDDYCPYDYILHIIVNGKVKETFENKIGEIDWSINNNVVAYYGELLNIKNSDELLEYINAQKEYWKKREEIRKNWNDLFSKSMKYFYGIGLLDKDSEERKERRRKIEEIHELMDQEEKRIEPELNELNNDMRKWFVDTSDIKDLIHLGEFIYVYNERDDMRDECREIILSMINANNELLKRYIEWQGSDEYVKEFMK